MFADMAQIVEAQEPVIQRTEENAIQTQEDVNKGNVEIDKANEHARRRRRLKWWCLLITVRDNASYKILCTILTWYFLGPYCHCYRAWSRSWCWIGGQGGQDSYWTLRNTMVEHWKGDAVLVDNMSFLYSKILGSEGPGFSSVTDAEEKSLTR